MNFLVQTRGAMADFDYNRKYVVISISNDGDDKPEIKETANLKDVLFLQFDDIDVPKQGHREFNDDHAREIINFYEHYKSDIDAIVVHCQMGMSRSPGVAAALQLVHDGDDDIWFKTKTPNRLVYRKILGAAAEKGLLG